jgi:hypothetical protein
MHRAAWLICHDTYAQARSQCANFAGLAMVRGDVCSNLCREPGKFNQPRHHQRDATTMCVAAALEAA